MNENAFKEKYLKGLNPQQMKAVETITGPTLLLAVPGSGKTTVLIKRLGYMTYCKAIMPENILVVTYTVSATQDMKQRYTTFFGDDGIGDRIEFRTINGICAKILLDFGYQHNKKIYTLAEDSYINRILIELYLKYDHEFPTEQDISALKLAIAYVKNMMYDKEDIKEYSNKLPFSLYDIYYDYVQRMKEEGYMDYDDQMVYTYNILKSFPSVLEKYQDKFKYICVDEAQDTSKIQHEILRLLADKYQNILYVGDEDQSIYGFRSAVPQYLLEMEQHYNNAQILLMETNYRSNANIVNMADTFIQKNKLRHPKTMVAFHPKSSKPKFINVSSRQGQYNHLLNVLSHVQNKTAVLYRNNESLLPIVDELERQGISYNLKNVDLTIFKHKSVVDIQNIVNFAADPYNTELFMKIYTRLNLYLNKEFALSVCNRAKKENKEVLDVAKQMCKTQNKEDFRLELFEKLQNNLKLVNNVNAQIGLNIILTKLRYNKYAETHKIRSGKIEILEILAIKSKNLKALFNRLNELKEIIANKPYDKNSKIILSTIHSSKGLEFDDVYLMDIIDGVFPESIPKNINKMDHDTRQIWEEERRLFYVAITRAKNNIYIYDIWHDSIFVNELQQNEKARIRKERQKAKIEQINQNDTHSELSYEEFQELLVPETRIQHQKYGKGKIYRREKDKIDVIFDGAFVKNTFNIKAIYSLGVVKILADNE